VGDYYDDKKEGYGEFYWVFNTYLHYTFYILIHISIFFLHFFSLMGEYIKDNGKMESIILIFYLVII